MTPINIEIGQSSDDDFCITGLTLKQLVELAILLAVDREETLDENVEKLYENWSTSYALGTALVANLYDDEFNKEYENAVMHTSEVCLIKEKLLKTILDHFKI